MTKISYSGYRFPRPRFGSRPVRVRSPTPSSTASFTAPIASIWPARACASGGPRHETDVRAKAGSPDPRRDKAVDNGGLRYGAMESALRPPLPTATRAFAEIQIQARLTNRSGQNIITSIRGSRCQVADIKSESRPASNRNRWPASGRNVWPASSESANDDRERHLQPDCIGRMQHRLHRERERRPQPKA